MNLIAIAFIAGCIGVGLLSGLFGGAGNSTWYLSLTKPAWQPPSWLFGPVWTILYALMGYAAYLVYRTPPSTLRTVALSLFAVQLALNALWTPIFFRYQLLGIASIEILILLVVLFATAITFFMLNRTAGYLLIPYVLWVIFATTLSITIWKLNP